MPSTHLNEHCANQGAQSEGEFLGMTGNSGWFLLGSVGVTLLMITFLWGMFGVSLLLCLAVGAALCGLSVAYVFGLKNNKPRHYDTDFFESALVEAGIIDFRFAPGSLTQRNPFPLERSLEVQEVRNHFCRTAGERGVQAASEAGSVKQRQVSTKPTVKQPAVAPAIESGDTETDHLRETLTETEELLEEALQERGEN